VARYVTLKLSLSRPTLTQLDTHENDKRGCMLLAQLFREWLISVTSLAGYECIYHKISLNNWCSLEKWLTSFGFFLAYVDNLVASTKVDKAAIYSRAGDSVWAQSVGFNVCFDFLSYWRFVCLHNFLSCM
jgi:hypothetical protein